MASEPASLLGPGNRRDVPYPCGCGQEHTTSVPAVWSGLRTMWLDCPVVCSTVRVVVDCDLRS